MGLTSRQIGCCLLLAWSLTGSGCSLVKDPDAQSARVETPPDPGMPLQIPDPPAPTPPPAGPIAQGSSPKSLLGEPMLANSPPYSQPATTAPAGGASSQRAALLLPVTNPLVPVAEDKVLPRPEGEQVFRSLARAAQQRFAATPAYYASLHRRELVDGKERPEELILFKYRKQPSAIYMQWLGKEAKDREVLYVRNEHDGMLNILPCPGDGLFGSVKGRQVILRPDSPRGLGKERYPVTETGIGALIERYAKVVDAYERGAKIGTLKFLPAIKRPEVDVPLETVLHVIPPGVDPTLPQGGQRLWYFDPELHFPVLVIAHDIQKREAEYYFFDKVMFPARITEDTFSATALGHH